MNKKTIAIIAIYALGFVVTYGKAWHTTIDSRQVKEYQNENVIRTFDALFGAAVWPLYWSVQAWK